MPFTEKRLCNPTQLTTSGQTLYTVPSSKTTIVKQIVVTNVTASAATFSLYIGSAATPNALFSATSVAANDTIIVNLSQVLTQNEILTALASANSTLNITISGVENDGPLTPTATYIADQAVTTAKLADSSVTTAKIAAGAVATADIADGAVTTEKIAAGAIVTADIANNAVTQAKLSTDIPLSGMRNLLINGDFRIWQRGTSFAAPANLSYTADRWFSTWGTAARTVSRQTGFSNSQYCLRVQRDSGSTSAAYSGINQIIESFNCYGMQGKQVTLSFDARCGANYSSSGSSLLVYLQTGTVADQGSGVIWSPGWTGIANPIATSVTLTTTAQRFTIVGNVSASTLEAAVTFQYLSSGTAGAADYFEITNVQLEIGSQMTPFEQRHHGTELSLCQRYYQTFVDPPLRGVAANDTRPTRMAVAFPVQMRVAPTSYAISGTLSFWDGATAGNYSSVYSYWFKNTHAEFDFNLTVGYTSGKAIVLYIGGGGSISFSSEL